MHSTTGSAGRFNATYPATVPTPAPKPDYTALVQDLFDKLASADPSVSAQVEDFLGKLVSGHTRDPALAQTVFNTMIEHEAYELFVAAFVTHQHLERTQAEADHQPYTSTLCLQLPDGWKPRAPAALVAAFEKVQVDRLEVLRAPVPQSPAQGSAPTQTPVCADVCDAILKLLPSGLREFKLQAALERGTQVAMAIGKSQQLEWLSLGDPMGSGPVDRAELDSYHAMIIHGASACSSLRQVALHGHRTVLALEVFVATRQKSPLPWTSLTLGLRDGSADVDMHLFDLLPGLLRQVPALSTLEVAARGLDLGTRGRALELLSAASAMEQLRRFSCDLGPLPTSAAATMRELLASNPDGLKRQPDTIRTAFQRPTCQLVEWTMKGYAWSPEGLRALSEELVKNKTVQRVDLSDGCLERNAMDEVARDLTAHRQWLELKASMAADIAAHGRLQSIKVPQDADNFYVMRPNGDIVDVESSSWDEGQKPMGTAAAVTSITTTRTAAAATTTTSTTTRTTTTGTTTATTQGSSDNA